MFRASISNLWFRIATVLAVCCLLTVGLCINTAVALNGSGTEEDPWKIESLADFDEFAADPNYWDDYTHLETDVNLAGRIYTTAVIAPDTDNSKSGFQGTDFIGFFDGKDHKITALTIDDGGAGNDFQGLFGRIYHHGEVRNLGLEGGSIRGYRYIGGLVGTNMGTHTVLNCYSTGNVIGEYYVGGLVGKNRGSISDSYSTGNVIGVEEVGGLVGENSWGFISNCYSTSSAIGDWYVGGLVGENYWGIVSNCYSTGSAIGDDYVAGLVGWNYGYHSSISNCYSTGDVRSFKNVGGLVGENSLGFISNCHSTGSVNGDYYVGGLVGHNYYGDVWDCFWDTDTQTYGVTESIGLNEGTVINVSGLPTTQMQTKSTFTEANWDFINERGNGTAETWQMPDGCGYPLLSFFHSEIPFPLIGSGNVSDPYLISDANDLGIVSWYSPGCYFKLMCDIDLSGIHWSVPVVPVFNGYFDGNNRRVLNMQISSRGYLGLFGFLRDQGQIRNLGLEGGSVNGGTYVGGLVGLNDELASISDCHTSVDVNGGTDVGGLVGENWGSVSNCYSTANVEGDKYIGGLVGTNEGVDTIWNCYSTGEVSGCSVVGGLVGYNYHGSVSNCYSTGDVSGISDDVGGLVGWNQIGRISNCYSASDVCSSGGDCAGGLVGKNRFGIVFDCYSTGYVSGWEYDGGLVGLNYQGSISQSFWDVQTSGMSYSDGGTGLPTDHMQITSTFINAGWDFNTPIWAIDEGVDYPHLWWEFFPVLHAEPEVTLGTSNRISWEPIAGDIEYYAECSADVNFTNIAYNSGWITETSYEFAGLELGKRYWYSVKARNTEGVESQWSNVESSLQCSLSDAVDIILDPNSLKNDNMKNVLMNKINVVLEMIDGGLYENALSKLENDFLQKTNGCAEMGEPDKNDWIISCEAQSEIYPLVIETIEYVKGLMEQPPQ